MIFIILSDTNWLKWCVCVCQIDQKTNCESIHQYLYGPFCVVQCKHFIISVSFFDQSVQWQQQSNVRVHHYHASSHSHAPTIYRDNLLLFLYLFYLRFLPHRQNKHKLLTQNDFFCGVAGCSHKFDASFTHIISSGVVHRQIVSFTINVMTMNFKINTTTATSTHKHTTKKAKHHPSKCTNFQQAKFQMSCFTVTFDIHYFGFMEFSGGAVFVIVIISLFTMNGTANFVFSKFVFSQQSFLLACVDCNLH